MNKLLLGLAATVVLATPLASATAANAATSSDSTCTPSAAVKQVTHTEYQWAALVAKPTLHWDYKWTASTKNPSTDILHIWVPSLDLTKKGLPQITRTVVDTPAKDAVTCAVTLPEFQAVNTDGNWTATIPFIGHVKTFLYGVPNLPHQGYIAGQPITGPVTVNSNDVGGSQFWIGYQPDDGYVAANAGTTHIDFYWSSSVTLPEFQAVNTDGKWSVTVPYTPNVETTLYGVPNLPDQGYIAGQPITGPVTVTYDDAQQFWIGYQPDAGYHSVNAGTTHIDFNAT
jgi:hypothetical protein